MTNSIAPSESERVVPRTGRWAAGLALLAFGVHLFACTSRIPSLMIGGLVVAIVLAALVFSLSLKTYVSTKDGPFSALRTFYLLLTLVAVVGGLLMLRELLFGLQVSVG